MKKMAAKDQLANYANTFLLTSFFLMIGGGVGNKSIECDCKRLSLAYFSCKALHITCQ